MEQNDKTDLFHVNFLETLRKVEDETLSNKLVVCPVFMQPLGSWKLYGEHRNVQVFFVSIHKFEFY